MSQSANRLVVLAVSPRVAPGLLSRQAWDVLRSGLPVRSAPGHPQLPALAAAGVDVELTEAAAVPDLAAAGGFVWLATDGDGVVATIGQALLRLADRPSLELVHGSWDLPGARLLDAVAVMDRLRSPGGCPWDAEQTHSSLAKYLLEEAYEAYQAIEDGDDEELREELGDLLLQVLFHARVATEDKPGWSIDDVAGALVDKLVSRHPHVFGDATVSGADEVNTRWEEIKAEQKGRISVTEGVPLSMASLALAAKLQRRAERLGPGPMGAFDAGDELGGDLWRQASNGDDAEVALRAVARRFRDELLATETAVIAAGLEPAALTPEQWREWWITA